MANEIFLSVDLNNRPVPPDPYQPPGLCRESDAAREPTEARDG